MSIRSFQVLLEWDPNDELCVTYAPILDYLPTFGETREEALENTREAVIGYLEAAAKDRLVCAHSRHQRGVSFHRNLRRQKSCSISLPNLLRYPGRPSFRWF